MFNLGVKYFVTEAKNAFYAQSGGVTSVINASACGVIETARKNPDKIANVYAGRNGIIGALTEDLIDTNQETDADIAALKIYAIRRIWFMSIQAESDLKKTWQAI